MSETMTVAVKLRPGEALTRALARCKATELGQGEHKLYASTEPGYGFQLKDWRYPCVIREKGTLAYDDYKGRWGDKEQLHELQQEYALQAAEVQAEALGLYCERHGDSHVTVHFGEGRTVTVDWKGDIEAEGFGGIGCDVACEQFAEALGQTLTIAHKVEYYQERARVSERGE